MTKIREGIEFPAMKPTRFVSNGWCILEGLSRRCPKLHVQEPLMGGKAAAAAQYPPDLCRAMCRGLVRQKQYENVQLAASTRSGRGELKSLIKKMMKGMGLDNQLNTVIKIRAKGSQRVDSIVRTDLMRVERRAESALMKSAEVSKEETHVSFGSDVVVGDDEPSPWTDCFQ